MYSYSWVFNNTSGSLLIAVLFHMTLNVAEWVVPIGLFSEGGANRGLIQVAVVWSAVAALVLLFGPQLRPLGTPSKQADPASVE